MPRLKGDRSIAPKLTGPYEKNNHLQGRSGSGTLIHKGPVGATPGNKTSGGGINRATKGKS